jgi:hypothetical protein
MVDIFFMIRDQQWRKRNLIEPRDDSAEIDANLELNGRKEGRRKMGGGSGEGGVGYWWREGMVVGRRGGIREKGKVVMDGMVVVVEGGGGKG